MSTKALRSLHSNLVIFKSDATNTVIERYAFTFQSGYIQIPFQPYYKEIPVGFTFQSGYIQIGNYKHFGDLGQSLHSNLVIFKLRTRSRVVPMKIFFTFQSGYIQMEVKGLDVIDVDTFTFQSGYIQMLIERMKLRLALIFTFQSGYIQMEL